MIMMITIQTILTTNTHIFILCISHRSTSVRRHRSRSTPRLVTPRRTPPARLKRVVAREGA